MGEKDEREGWNKMDKVVENIWKEIGGNKKEIMSIEDVGEYKTKVGDMIESRERKSLRQKVDKEEHLKIYGGLREGVRMKTYVHGPIDYAKKHKTAISSRRPRPTRKKEELYQ